MFYQFIRQDFLNYKKSMYNMHPYFKAHKKCIGQKLYMSYKK